jgi:NAD(P)-dependent dehydrogenase (short-subunit alcohol dehydrogenase family)
MAVQTDLRDAEQIQRCVDRTIARFGRVDILINNASALWWQDIVDTPAKRYDLITQINARGTFLMTKACMPHMLRQKHGRVVTMSPPISLHGYAGRTAYNISKFGMTIVAKGVAEEGRDAGVTGNSLWPATVIESLASINFQMGTKEMWRKATILADAVLGIVSEGDDFSGHMLIDDEYLRERHGFSDEDFVQYRCDPDTEPPRVLASEGAGEGSGHGGGGTFKRGSIARLEDDKRRTTIDIATASGPKSRL